MHRYLDFVELLVVLEELLGWAQGNLSVRSDFFHVTLACDNGSIQANKDLSWPLP